MDQIGNVTPKQQMFAQKNVLLQKKSTCSFRKTRIFLDVGWTWWTPTAPLIFKEYMDANLVEDAREALHNSSLLGQRIRVERRKGRKGWEVNAVVLPGTPLVFVCVPVYLLFYLLFFICKKKFIRRSHYPSTFTSTLYRCICSHINKYIYIYTYEYIYIFIYLFMYMNIYI